MVSFKPLSFTSASASDDPIADSCCARHRPIPEPAPVMTATPPSNIPICSPSSPAFPRGTHQHPGLLPHFLTRGQRHTPGYVGFIELEAQTRLRPARFASY